MAIRIRRLFVAIHLQPSEVLLALLHKLKRQLAHERINWVRPDNIHLTLKFLGETPENKMPVISKALQELVKDSKPFLYQSIE